MDNFDTPTVITVLDKLKSTVYRYLEEEKDRASLLTVRAAADWISHIFRVFGLIDTEIGFSAAGQQSVAPYLDILSHFRDQVRETARKNDVDEKKRLGEILKLSDELRDTALPEVGIKLEDRVGESSIWKIYDPEELQLYRAQKAAAEVARKKKAEEAAERQRLEDEKNSVPPLEIFKRNPQYAGYSFDEEGIPTQGPDGKPVPPKTVQKLKKVLEGHAKKHVAWQAKQVQ